MKQMILSLTLICLFLSCGHALPDSVQKKAGEYKGFDELIDRITEVEYMNRTYYWVTYTKTLMPSGSVLLDDETRPVEDIETLKLFAQADMIHRNYPPESVTQWVQFSNYFNTLSGVFSKSNPSVSRDSRMIGELLANSAAYLNGSISCLSPEYTQKYLAYEEQASDLMSAAYDRTPADEGSEYLTEYLDSLKNIGRILSDNREGLDKGGEYMAELMAERVLSEKNRPAADIYTIGAAVALILFVFLVVKRGKKQQPN
jgi:hypothetical protein